MKYLLLSLVVLTSGCERIITPQSIFENDAAVKQLKNEKVPEALSTWSEVLQEEPFQPEVHLNLGLSYEILKDQEKAFSFYKGAERFADKRPDLKFASHFNQAQLYGKLKKYDEALFYYQKALEIIPTSKEVKTNIELLIKLQQDEQKKDKSDEKKDGGENGEKSDEQKEQDKKDQDKKDEGKDKKDGEDKDKKEDDKDGKGEKEEKPKEYGKNPKPMPKPFEGKELSEGDVKKILGELKQQEQKIRANFNKKQGKDRPKDKDW